ncbi:hypothetical protein [Paenibacillus elgii]|uniref:hypothetical protein n=1 Tax=Paenibacillus elgii TaxID=189691 RepID=UPI000248D934|nr:hypothetical protein [Paenibacillus elgii]
MLIGKVDNTIHQQNPYANKAENRQTTGAIDKADNASKVESKKVSGALIEPHDEYIPSSERPNETPGIYRLEKDENGLQKIVFDRPDSTAKGEQAGMAEKKTSEDLPKVAPDQAKEGESPEKKDGPDKSGDKEDRLRCTVDTGNVDDEIKKLKEEKKQIEQQLKSAGDDENKRKDLEKKLSQVQSKLSAKDNDTYRKQNATYTYN